MCGIYLSENPIDPTTKNYIAARGKSFQTETTSGMFHLFSSVLAIRSTVPQPVAESGYILMYNGEIYNGEESDTLFIAKVINEEFCSQISEDSLIQERFDALTMLYNRLKLEKTKSLDRTDDILLESELAVAVTDGEFVYFFKDDVGKRSLGYKLNPFVLCSVKYEIEIDPMKLYIYDGSEKALHWKFKEKTGIIDAYFSRMKLIRQYLFSEKYIDQYSFFTGYKSVGGCEAATSVSADHNRNKTPTNIITNIKKLDGLLRKSFIQRKHTDNPIIFFSGGIDSFITALYIHMTIEEYHSIYLINTGISGSFDRIEGLNSYKDLQDRFPHRKFIFIPNDLILDEIKPHQDIIKDLTLPKTGKMDINISNVMYFSAMCAKCYGNVIYTGAGADEIFGGYRKYTSEYKTAIHQEEIQPKEDDLQHTKHSTIDKCRVCEDIRAHMLFDIFTISAHNIGRDDRAISHWNVEARFPFLDYKIIEWALELPLCSLIREGPPLENKAILRDLLRFHGFERAASVPKKAMQYGTGMSRFEAYM